MAEWHPELYLDIRLQIRPPKMPVGLLRMIEPVEIARELDELIREIEEQEPPDEAKK